MSSPGHAGTAARPGPTAIADAAACAAGTDLAASPAWLEHSPAVRLRSGPGAAAGRSSSALRNAEPGREPGDVPLQAAAPDPPAMSARKFHERHLHPGVPGREVHHPLLRGVY